MHHVKIQTWRKEKKNDMIKHVKEFKNVDIDQKTSPNLILYIKDANGENGSHVALITRAE